MKHLKKSLVLFAVILFVTGVVTSFGPSLTKGQKSSDVKKSAFSITMFSVPDQLVQVVSGPDPQTTNYAITSFTVTNQSENETATVLISGSWGSNTTDCVVSPGADVPGPQVTVRAGETVHLSFPQPFVLSALPGTVSCLRLGNFGSDAPLTYMVVGYRF
jgi:hypothetical protein